MIDPISEYIRQYRDTYSREAIDWQLLGAGYSQEEINAAWEQASLQNLYPSQQGNIPNPPSSQGHPGWGDSDYQPPRKQRVVNRPLFWGVLVAFIVLSYGLPVLFVSLAGFTSDNAGLSSLFGWLALGSFIALALIAVFWGAFAINRNRPLGMGLLFGVLMTVVVIPFVALFIVLGICLTSLVNA